jgi:CheY-like chemotaxis protein
MEASTVWAVVAPRTEPGATRKNSRREQVMNDSSQARPRILVVEDEYLIRMLLEDMLADLGYAVAAAVGTITEASALAANGDFSAAILDVNLDGEEIFPVADILKERGLPFVFVTGYGERSLPEPYRDRPALQKPFQAEQLEAALGGLLASA